MPKLLFFNRKARNIRQAFRQLEKYPLTPAEIDKLSFLAENAPAHELYKMNPVHLAQKLEQPFLTTLDWLTMMAAEHLWKLEWEAWCPECNNRLQNVDNLGQLESQQTCPECGWTGEIHLDREITVQASLGEHLRKISEALPRDLELRQLQEDKFRPTNALALVNRPLFRELIGEHILPEFNSLGVQHLAVFFSDLKSSTAMYRRMGDADAYRLVIEHFEVIFKAVEKHGGSAVKTIGDGVMGAFFDSKSALHGIHETVKRIEDLNRRAGLCGDERLRLKIGLHAGPCIVVTLNKRLDYFGTTINIASRLSTLGEGDDLLLSQAVLLEDGAAEMVNKIGDLKPETVSLRGIQVPLQAFRLHFR